MFWKAFVNKLNYLSTGILRIKVEYGFRNCVQQTLSSQVIREESKNVEERVLGIFEDPRDVQEVGPVRTNIKAPEWMEAIAERAPDKIKSFGGACGRTSNYWDLMFCITSQGLQQAICGS